jgi:hypothetical protein
MEERSMKTIEQEQRRCAAMMEELSAEREENENLRTIIDYSNEEIQKLKSTKEQFEEEC